MFYYYGYYCYYYYYYHTITYIYMCECECEVILSMISSIFNIVVFVCASIPSGVGSWSNSWQAVDGLQAKISIASKFLKC